MAQATFDPTAAITAHQDHYALSEEHKMRLHLLGRALDGLADLSCPDAPGQYRQETSPVREDLAALFTVFRYFLDDTTKELPFIRDRDLVVPPVTVTIQ